MALIACKECGNQVSDSAAACPKCGAAVAKKSSAGGCLGGFFKWSFVVFLGLIVVGAIFSNDDKKEARYVAASESQPSALAVDATGNPGHDQLLGLSEGGRNVGLAALLQKSGERCPEVTQTMHLGMNKDREAYWNVRCNTAKSYMIAIAPNSTGSTTITDCDVLKVANVKCWEKF